MVMTTDKLGFLNRRGFMSGAVGLGSAALFQSVVPSYAYTNGAPAQTAPRVYDLTVAKKRVKVGGRRGRGVTVNGGIPGPLLRFKEGEDVTINVRNTLGEDTSIHWHGLILPNAMDGVPKVTFQGIKPGQTFTYRIPIRQSGTYWYHSHSGLQEQSGHYGPIIIDPIRPDPFKYQRDYVVMLSDWTFENPYSVLRKIKTMGSYYNFQKQTVVDFMQSVGKNGAKATFADRTRWGAMRMDPTDIADVTGATYHYLMNGMTGGENWTGLFRSGEKIRLRFINGAAMTYFDVRIPGLKMTVVAADGQNVKPVRVDEFRIGVAETFDVIVEPDGNKPYTIFAETMDRSGFARGTLAPQMGMQAGIPARRTRPVRGMADMGMMPGGMSMDGGMAKESSTGMKDMKSMSSDGMAGMTKGMEMPTKPQGKSFKHGPDKHLPGSAMVSMYATDQTANPGIGLGNDGRRVLTYKDLRSLVPYEDKRKPAREIELHLTGVMERYMWSFDGKKFSEVKGPIQFRYGERLRLILRNDTMMEHPIHLHGMWMELENGQGKYLPRKHTINVKPAERVSVRVTADAPGNWAFHCHLLYHMEMGMFRVVTVA
ncbi:copper resistance system multicopper oxidase [Sulfitobacter sp. SK025]|uniref:copper resistance system multicopper oxidase n=1 Tax=Sulfitobacter sp. SK025 TaxID=1389011 RepID=UPI000E0BE957|nr:copper resistance protein CopA [Sulfitobacter sp. SK025]|tara:strand:- start:1269 stop:3056 length:1788 start_codon:yes stop_codon:yes gene_type:complete